MSYQDASKDRLSHILAAGHATVLAIETSCDETAAAVVRDGRQVLSSAVHTQIPLHIPYGGVVPEIASRNHVEMIGPVVDKTLSDGGFALKDMDAVAVTHGPGLVGALLVGVSYAKGLALAQGLPLVGVNHILSHIAANFITDPSLIPPFTCLIASGGHSHIVFVEDYGRCRLIGRTRDDAAGEAFDKVARVLGLPYPGGPSLERLAQGGDPDAVAFHSAFNEGDSFDYSFSGLKTSVINYLHIARQSGVPVNEANVAASFQKAVVTTLSRKAVRAAVLQRQGCPSAGVLALAGGVSANRALREHMERACAREGLRFVCPEPRYCTDNAAMVGSAAFYELMNGRLDGLALNAQPSLSFLS